MKTVFEEWKSYERDVVPPDAPAVQREECRRAFYAGAFAMFGLVITATEPRSEEDCEANLQGLQDECLAIVKDLRTR